MQRAEALRAMLQRPVRPDAEHMWGLMEETLSGHEEEVCRLKREKMELSKLVSAAWSPQVVLHTAALPPELQQLPPEQQERCPGLGQEELGPPHIKEEEEEFPVKTEHDEECAQWSQLHQRQTEEEREAEAVASTSTQQMETQVVEVEVEVDPQTETEDSDGGWEETAEPPSALPPELQQLSVCKEELPPEQQEQGPGLGQEEPGPPHIKEEEEEFPVKTEHDEECAQWSQLHQRQTEEEREAEAVASTSTQQMETQADGEDWGVSEAASSSDPAAALQPAGAEQLFSSHSSQTDTEDSDGGREETADPPSGVKSQSAWTLGLEHIKKSHSELYFQHLRSGEIRAQSLLPFAVSQPIGTSGATPTQKDTPGNHSCDLCGKTFRWPCRLKAHQTVHTGEKSFHCDQCEKTCTTKSQLKVHQRIHSGERPYQCLQCAKSFRKKSVLDRHQLIHTGERSYHCEQCGKSFYVKNKLTEHQRCHTGEKPYHCQQCGKRFNAKADLDVHRRIHTGEKPYRCEQCGKSFNAQNKLKLHQRIHTGERPYHCEQCGKSFNAQNKVTRHQRIHTGAKPYRCPQCLKSFTWSSQLKTHHCVQTAD